MTLQEALKSISPQKGVTSVIAGLMNGDLSVIPNPTELNVSLETANEKISHYQKQLDECKSDWAYWSILGDLEYWESVRDILEAGTINNGILADVPPPVCDSVVMDNIGRVRDFGRDILQKTRKQNQ